MNKKPNNIVQNHAGVALPTNASIVHVEFWEPVRLWNLGLKGLLSTRMGKLPSASTRH